MSRRGRRSGASLSLARPWAPWHWVVAVALAAPVFGFTTQAGACGNVSKKDADGESWMYVPSGTCLKIVGGSLAPKKIAVRGVVAALPRRDSTEVASAPESGLPASLTGAGIGLRAPHMREVLAGGAAGRWLEIHAENYMSGRAVKALADIGDRHPISIHGVGLSLGAAEPLNREHAQRLRLVVEMAAPIFVSEHLSFSGVGGVYTNTLAPLPYDDESLLVMVSKVDELQSLLGRQILIENPARYLEFRGSPFSEPQFLKELAARTGCGLLCDLTNLYVSAVNLGFDALSYLDEMPGKAVKEIHLAGHATKRFGDTVVVFDDHGSAVSQPVWQLWAEALLRWGPVPALIEWDTALPNLDVLIAEAALADHAMSALEAEMRCQT